MGTSSPTAEPTPRHRHRLAKTLVGIVAALLVLLAVYAALLLASLSTIRGQASAVEADATRLQAAVDDLDLASVSAATNGLSESVGALNRELSGWTWAIASALPIYGGDVRAARQTVAVADDLVQNVLAPLVGAAEGYLGGVSEQGFAGLFDSEALGQVEDALTGAAPRLRDAKAALDGVGPTHFADLDAAIDELRTLVDGANDLLDNAGSASELLDNLAGRLGLS